MRKRANEPKCGKNMQQSEKLKANEDKEKKTVVMVMNISSRTIEREGKRDTRGKQM